MTLTAHPIGHVVELREGSRLVATVPQPDDADAIASALDARSSILAYIDRRIAAEAHRADELPRTAREQSEIIARVLRELHADILHGVDLEAW